MIRRDFLNSLLSSSLLNLLKSEKDADKLINRIEKETIHDPVLGEIPYKLYEYQKNIIRQICENDRVIFLKARQIGMTTLLDAYARHTDIDYKHNAPECINGLHTVNEKYVLRSWYKYYTENQIIAQEINFFKPQMHTFTISFKEIITRSEKEKIIIAGSVDPHGNMKWAKANAKRYGFKFFTYTINDCKHEWDYKKIKRFDDIKHTQNKQIWSEEMECNL